MHEAFRVRLFLNRKGTKIKDLVKHNEVEWILKTVLTLAKDY
jgi:hypothetical protein